MKPRAHRGLDEAIREYLKTTRKEWWTQLDPDLLEEIIEGVLAARARLTPWERTY